MTLSVPIDADTEARLRLLANEAGKDLGTYILELVSSATLIATHNGTNSVADFDNALDELFAGDKRRLPSLPLNFSREDIYFDHN